MRFSASQKRTTRARRAAAIFFAVWLSGAACLVCCERAETSAHAGESAAAVAREHAPSVSSKHSCCEARVRPRRVQAHNLVEGHNRVESHRRAEGRAPRLGDDARAISELTLARPGAAHRGCCRNSRQTLDAARKPRLADAPDWADATRLPVLAARATPSADAPQPRPRPPDRGGTHLLNCVLLI